MNTKLTISLVVLLAVAGGTYMTMGTDTNLKQYIPSAPQSLVQYLPDPVKSFLSDDATDGSDENIDTGLDNINSEDQLVESEFVEESEQSEEVVEVEQTEPEQVEESNQGEDTVMSEDGESLEAESEELRMEIQQEIQDNIENTSLVSPLTVDDTTKESAVNHNEANQDAMALEKMIKEINNEIAMLDVDNQQLEQTFQKILRENRTLAERLRELDKQIAAIQ